MKNQYIKSSSDYRKADYRKAPGYRALILISAFVIWVATFAAALLLVG
jgi:hypothetical protein